MLQYAVVDFEHWRRLARQLRLNRVHPQAVQFLPSSEQLLFSTPEPRQAEVAGDRPHDQLRVSKEFLSLAENAGFYRNNNRWNVLYRILWRLTTAEPKLMQIVTNDDVYALMLVASLVGRSILDLSGSSHFSFRVGQPWLGQIGLLGSATVLILGNS